LFADLTLPHGLPQGILLLLLVIEDTLEAVQLLKDPLLLSHEERAELITDAYFQCPSFRNKLTQLVRRVNYQLAELLRTLGLLATSLLVNLGLTSLRSFERTKQLNICLIDSSENVFLYFDSVSEGLLVLKKAFLKCQEELVRILDQGLPAL